MDAATRRLAWQRADNRCEYCRLHQDHESFFRFQVEHIIAKQHGGGDGPENLALSCHHDNEHKGPSLSGIDPQTGKTVRLFHPRRQRWRRHFRLDGPFIIGRTASGRATVTVLALNHPDRVDLRRELIAAGLFGSV